MQEKYQFFDNIKERIIYFVENQRIKKVDFFSKIGVTSANFRGNQLKSSLSSTSIERIITLYPEVNLYWLLTGKGEMLRGFEIPTEQAQGLSDKLRLLEEQNELLKSSIELLKENKKQSEEIISFYKEKIQDLEQKLQNCEDEKKPTKTVS